MKIIITGGHFSPAYTVLKKLIQENEIVVIGRKYAFEGDTNETLEYKLCQKENIPFISLNAGRLQRVLTKHTVNALLRFPKGIYETVKILKKEKPDVVLTFGGYVGLSVAIASFILKIPVILHEQTQKAGLSSRLISKFSSVTCISFSSSYKYFKNKKTVLTGNPIREEIFKFKDMDISKDIPIIYVTGGSTGSHIINEKISEILEKLLENYTVVHQIGNSAQFNDFEKLKKQKEKLSEKFQKRYVISEFFKYEEVGWLLHNSSLVISRAGINTVSELLACDSIGLLIPLPHGQSNEQLDNAVFFKKLGFGEYIEQKELTQEIFFKTISDMIDNRENYIKKREKNDNFVQQNAAEKIIEQVLFYGRQGQGNRNPSN